MIGFTVYHITGIDRTLGEGLPKFSTKFSDKMILRGLRRDYEDIMPSWGFFIDDVWDGYNLDQVHRDKGFYPIHIVPYFKPGAGKVG